MSTLSSSSTYADIVDAYLDSASFEEDGDTAKCKAFITACRMLIRLPAETSVGGSKGVGHQMKFDLETLQKEMAQARNWLAANETVTGTRTTYGDFTDFRE